jgi:hypothetical protein
MRDIDTNNFPKTTGMTTPVWSVSIAALCVMSVGCKTLTPSAEIETVVGTPRIGLESALSYSVNLSFRNTGAADCVCLHYRIDWNDGQKEVSPYAAFLIPVGRVVKRSCAIGYISDPEMFERTAFVTVFCDR